MSRWRVGTHVPINVYDGDRPVCQCQTAVDAAKIVRAVNTLKGIAEILGQAARLRELAEDGWKRWRRVRRILRTKQHQLIMARQARAELARAAEALDKKLDEVIPKVDAVIGLQCLRNGTSDWGGGSIAAEWNTLKAALQTSKVKTCPTPSR